MQPSNLKRRNFHHDVCRILHPIKSGTSHFAESFSRALSVSLSPPSLAQQRPPKVPLGQSQSLSSLSSNKQPSVAIAVTPHTLPKPVRIGQVFGPAAADGCRKDVLPDYSWERPTIERRKEKKTSSDVHCRTRPSSVAQPLTTSCCPRSHSADRLSCLTVSSINESRPCFPSLPGCSALGPAWRSLRGRQRSTGRFFRARGFVSNRLA